MHPDARQPGLGGELGSTRGRKGLEYLGCVGSDGLLAGDIAGDGDLL